jgi:tetratricopeptide (TPR) repeat protein
MTQHSDAACGEDRIRAILDVAEQASERAIEAIDHALEDHPSDPRLHFLRGSLLIDLNRFVDAHAALTQATELAPEFHLARFQLGFFELTSGEADAARASWEPLKRALPPNHHLMLFVAGLESLIDDRFAECVDTLRRGIAANIENLPLNRDMQLIIDKCEELLPRHDAVGQHEPKDDISAASLLLGTRRH